MTENQEIKMRLLKEFGITDDKRTVDFCREAYRFIKEDEVKEVVVRTTPVPSADYSKEPVAVDLGLPSGTLWCDRNVGATSPTDDGAYFSWGNTEPHYAKNNENEWGDAEDAFDYSFDEDTYSQTDGASLQTDIDLAHDAARVNMGAPWCMPTKEQFLELHEHCIWQRKTIDGKNGYLVTSKKNGNSIFVACSGHGNGTTRYYRGSYGFYWSSSWDSDRYARYLFFGSGGVGPQSASSRYDGFALRPVQNLSKK